MKFFTLFRSKSTNEESNSGGSYTSRSPVPFDQLDFNELEAQPSPPAPLQSRRGSRHIPSTPRPHMFDYSPQSTWPSNRRHGLTMAVTRSTGFGIIFRGFNGHGRTAMYLNTDSAGSYEDFLRLDENNVKRGVNMRVIANLVVMATEEDVKKKCPICLVNFHAGGKLARTPCKHKFHESCLKTWLSNHRTCPSCRWEFPDGDTHLVR
eukprot:jgi/Botrbrau1/18450/Bobra.0072s0033.1